MIMWVVTHDAWMDICRPGCVLSACVCKQFKRKYTLKGCEYDFVPTMAYRSKTKYNLGLSKLSKGGLQLTFCNNSFVLIRTL